jgi:hypothetical protein
LGDAHDYVLKEDVEGYDFQELFKNDEIASLMVKMCCGFKFCVISRLYFLEFHTMYLFC